MYESYFGLRSRPFAAVPDANALVELPSVVEATERLDRCVRDGRGIAVLTAAPGRGKTQLCMALQQRWSADYITTLLPNASHASRRGLLRAILCELGHSTGSLTEAELRYDLQATAAQARRDAGGLVLIFDEADRYSAKLLEEIRHLTNLVAEGEPLVRIVLSAREELEERLADPSLAGIQDRIGTYASLPRLTAAESQTYLQGRVAAARGELNGLFDDAAVEAICRSAGGTARCLNQLADHTLLLGYVAECRPVTVDFVREALDDLRRLPLPWMGDSGALASMSNSVSNSKSSSLPEQPNWSDEPTNSEFGSAAYVFETGDEAEPVSEQRPVTSRDNEGRRRPRSIPWQFEAVETAPAARPNRPKPAEETVADRYAQLDAREQDRLWQRFLQSQQQTVSANAGSIELETSLDADEVLNESSEVQKRQQLREPNTRPEINPLALLDQIEPLVAAELAFDRSNSPAGELTTERLASHSRKIRETSIETLLQVLQGAVGEVSEAPDVHNSRIASDPGAALSGRQSLSQGDSAPRQTPFRELRKRRETNR